MKKLFKQSISILLLLVMFFSISSNAFASEERDPYTIEGHYVQELLDLSDEELSALSFSEAKRLFEKAFYISSANFTEDEVRLGLNGLSFGLKYQNKISAVKANEPSLYSTTGNTSYSGSVGVAWTRDTRSGYSPLTLGEILSGTYTLEVDYITWDTAATLLAASANYNAFNDLVELAAVGAAGTKLASYICGVLGIGVGAPTTIASLAVGTAVAWGWNWLNKIDRSNMLSCFNEMNKNKNQYMKVQYMWSGNMVNKIYSRVSKNSTITNPFSGTYGDWHKDTYGYLYNL